MQNGTLGLLLLVALVAGSVRPDDLAAGAAGSVESQEAGPWPSGFRIIRIVSSVDQTEQRAYHYGTTSSANKPLVVSLHTWGGDFTQKDPLAAIVKQHNWNYIHPDFRGPNRTVQACLSPKAITDIDDAIAYATNQGRVDRSNIFVVGASGGGYATVGMYLKSVHPVRAFLAWVPITDLRAWYWQSTRRRNGYAGDIRDCTGSGDRLDEAEALKRSPLYWELPPSPKSLLELYAGIDDGYTGSVPVSHSILFYNRLLDRYKDPLDQVTEEEIASVLTRGMANDPAESIGERAVILRRQTKYASITVFDGGHEILPRYCFSRMKKMVEHSGTLTSEGGD